MRDEILRRIREKYPLIPREMGELKELKKGMYRFNFECYRVGEIGNLFAIDMSAMFGLMKMETVVLTPIERDLSFCNFDVVHAMGTDTCIFEMYDTGISERDLSSFDPLKEKYADLPAYETKPRWYDSWRLSPSIGKRGKGLAARGEEMLEEHLNEYLRLLAQAPACDPEEKRERNRRYVDRLLAEGGAAVDSMKKLLGEEKTDRLIRRFMFDV